MDGFPSRKDVERIKKQYPVGTRIELISMDDPHAPIEPGMHGTVDIVDDVGTLHMKWDNGRTLGIVPGGGIASELFQNHRKKVWSRIKSNQWEG